MTLINTAAGEETLIKLVCYLGNLPTAGDLYSSQRRGRAMARRAGPRALFNQARLIPARLPCF